MKIYTINIVTSTKNKELYERVAVNEYPLVIRCTNEDRLKEILKDRVEYIRQILKTETLYNHAVYMIRELTLNERCEIRDFEIPVKDIVLIYNELE